MRHLVTKVRGHFTDFSGTIQFDEAHPDQSSIALSINAASIDTGTPDRDAHLRSGDFFAADQYPTLTFTSSKVTRKNAESFDVEGTLTIRDTAKRLTVPVTSLGERHGSVGQRARRLRGRDHDQPEGLRPELERGARDGRLPGRRRREDQRFASGDRGNVD